MATAGDIFEVKVQTAGANGKLALNVYQYRIRANSGLVSSILLGSFVYVVFPKLKDIMHNAAKIVAIDVRNLFALDDFDSRIYVNEHSGTLTGTQTPAFVAAQLVAPRKRLDMRQGAKRYPFMTEEVMAVDTWTTPFLDALVALQGTLDAAIVATEATWDGVVVKRIKYTEGGKTKYRMPNSQAELIYYEADWVVDRDVTTQNTRKRRT